MVRAGNALEIDLSAGVKLTTDPLSGSGAGPFDAVAFLQPLNNGVVYLSDVQSAGYKHIPFLTSSWPYERDRSVSGGHLRFGDQVLLKGLGMHSSSRLTYELPGQYRWLQAELAIDRRAGLNGSVVYRVYLRSTDGQWSKAFESGVVRGGQAPVPMRVDARDCDRIALIVDFADRAGQWDHANWLNARLVR